MSAAQQHLRWAANLLVCAWAFQPLSVAAEDRAATGPGGRPLSLATGIPPATATSDTRRSGLLDMGPALQALQRDDGQNPAMLWVQQGEQLWATPAGPRGLACARCHGGGPGSALAPSVRNAAATYPAWDAASGRVLNLADRIARCQQQHQQTAPWPTESEPALALAAWLGWQARGQPIQPGAPAVAPATAAVQVTAQPGTSPAVHPQLLAARAQGQAIWQQRLGQLNLACAHCHDQHAGSRLGGAVIPQGHATGYPAYRLEWQALGSLQRRLRNCLAGVRAEPWPPDAPEWRALEAWMAWRSRGMAVETPAVRP